jgi:hypothetical protein
MKKHALMATATAFILACGVMAARAQQSPESPMMQQPDQMQQQFAEEGSDEMEHGSLMGHGGMMGRGVMGHEGMMGHGMIGRRGSPFVMRLIFALMDSDGDGTISLEEFQAAHERIFKAMDADKDGTVTLEEMQDFMRGTSRPAPQH